MCEDKGPHGNTTRLVSATTCARACWLRNRARLQPCRARAFFLLLSSRPRASARVEGPAVRRAGSTSYATKARDPLCNRARLSAVPRAEFSLFRAAAPAQSADAAAVPVVHAWFRHDWKSCPVTNLFARDSGSQPVCPQTTAACVHRSICSDRTRRTAIRLAAQTTARRCGRERPRVPAAEFPNPSSRHPA